MKRIENIAEVGTLSAATVCFSQSVELAAVPHLGEIKDGCGKVVDVATGDSSTVVQNEKILKRTTIPCSPIFGVVVSESFQEFGCHEDFVVFLFNFYKGVAKTDHCLLVSYD